MKNKILKQMKIECGYCRMHPAFQESLAEEGGVTDRSLHNAHVLFRENSFPGEMYFAGKNPDDCEIVCKWFADGVEVKSHRFTGLGWMHRGTGSRGFVKFLELLSAHANDHFFK